MPTIRSKYSIEQFEEVLQKLAHEVAIDAVINLNKGYAKVTISGSRFTHVEAGRVVQQKSEWGGPDWESKTPDHLFRFYANRMSYFEDPVDKDGWGFHIEKKEYLTSNHCTKISFYAAKGKRKQVEDQVMAFIDGMMAEASMKPVPRFKLSRVVN